MGGVTTALEQRCSLLVERLQRYLTPFAGPRRWQARYQVNAHISACI